MIPTPDVMSNPNSVTKCREHNQNYFEIYYFRFSFILCDWNYLFNYYFLDLNRDPIYLFFSDMDTF